MYFTPFYFKNGNAPKPKYFIVLKMLEEHAVLASLPTRKDCVPRDNNLEAGCIEVPSARFNCYKISNKTPITACGKCLPFTTYLYGHELDSHELDILNSNYQYEGVDYEVYGKINPEIFSDIIRCFKESRSVKRKYKRVL